MRRRLNATRGGSRPPPAPRATPALTPTPRGAAQRLPRPVHRKESAHVGTPAAGAAHSPLRLSAPRLCRWLPTVPSPAHRVPSRLTPQGLARPWR